MAQHDEVRERVEAQVRQLFDPLVPEVIDEIEIRHVPIDHPDGQDLIAQVQAEYVERYGGPDASPMETAEFVAPAGMFFVAYAQGEPVATGAWRRRTDVAALGADVTAEIKRMYVVPGLRRHGVARCMLGRLEQSVRQAGHQVIVLNTGAMQPEAIAMYEATGYERLAFGWGTYADSPNALFFAKRLVPVGEVR